MREPVRDRKGTSREWAGAKQEGAGSRERVLNKEHVVILTTGVRELARDRNCNSRESGGSGEREEWGAGGVGGGEWEWEGVRSGEGDACDVVVPDDV